MASRSWNRVELIGNLTRDPELRYTPNGAAVCTFGLATNRTFVSEGEKREEVDFHRLVSWNKLAELCNQLLKKGQKVFISGRLQTRSWEAQDGQTRQVTEIVIEDMILLSPKLNGEAAALVSENIQPQELPKEKVALKEPEEKEAKDDVEEKTKTSSAKAAEETAPVDENVDPDKDLPF